MSDGILAGFPVVDIGVVLLDGSSHSVDSSGMAFEIAGSYAFRQGVNDARPVLLEPVMKVRVVTPDDLTGEIMGDLNTRRAHIAGMSPEGGVAVIEAGMPLVEAQQYSTHLRALTQGRGSFVMEFGHYGEVPQHLVQKIVDAGKRNGVATGVHTGSGEEAARRIKQGMQWFPIGSDARLLKMGVDGQLAAMEAGLAGEAVGTNGSESGGTFY